jgi:gliding motility-associated-like protein
LCAQSYWLQNAGGLTPDEATSISLDNSNNCYATGYFSSTAHFGATNLNSTGVSDVFVTKLNSTGAYQWTVHAGGGTNSDRGLCIKADANGNTYVTGYFSGIATFGSTQITSAGLQDVFVAKYSPSGVFRWVVSAGGSQTDIGNSITVDNLGDVYITGEFTGSATFGSINLTANGSNVNVFTARLDSSNGNFIWAKSGTGPHTDRGISITADASGNAYVTGQFSDTITFNIAHFTPLVNAIFIVKYDRSGNEVWFTKAGAPSSQVSAITSDASSNIYVTGNFTGTLTFYAANGTPTLGNLYPDRIFVAKYDANANIQWQVSDGSSSPITSNNISLDNSGNPYIIGNFECILNSYADQYGQGTFNTVGYWDIFVSEYNSSSGAWQWSRQIGGHLNNYGNGIATSATGDIYTAGSFDKDVIVPADPNFSNTIYNYSCNTTYCSDVNYGTFDYIPTYGNLDAFIAKPIDLSRQPYDFYLRSGSGCNRPQVDVCITDGNSGGDCLDTVTYCQSGTLIANSNTCYPTAVGAGPAFKYLWSTNHSGGSLLVSSTGWYSVTETSVDGCFKSTDSIYVIINSPPPAPTISDNVVINTNSTSPQPIVICADSVKLTGGNYGSNTYYWKEPNGTQLPLASFEDTGTGTYCFVVTDNNGCSNQTCVRVELDKPLLPIKPELRCVNCRHDSIVFCKGGNIKMFPYDSLTNPHGIDTISIPPPSATKVLWNVAPSTIGYSPITTSGTYFNNLMTPADTGWYHITARIDRKNACDSTKDTLSDSIFVRFYPQPPPIFLTITGKTKLCPGDSTWLVAHGAHRYHWSVNSTMDSIKVTVGTYSVTSDTVNSYGCISAGEANASVTFIAQPNLSTNPPSGVICPGDSVRILCSGKGSFTWEGPNGPLLGTDSIIYVKNVGAYYCILSDTNGCDLLSNTINIEQYSTPYLISSPNGIICPGDSAKVSVVATNGSLINWLSPLSGNDSVKYIKSSGTYQCNVTACGITTPTSVNLNFAHPVAHITPSGPTSFCVGDSITLTANLGMAIYSWVPGNDFTTSIVVKTTGNYILTTEDTSGCKAYDTVGIFTEKPNGTISPGQTICAGTTITLTVTAASGTKYNWSTGGKTNTIHAAPDSTTVYYVIITNTAGCTDTLTSLVTVYKVPTLNACCNDTIMPGDTVTLYASGNPANSYKWSPDSGLYCTSCPDPIAAPNATTTYTVSRYDSNGCNDSKTVTIYVERPCADFRVPNVFTPNNDGIDDDFVIQVTNVTSYSIYIYDRWGQEVYNSTNPNQYWNGRVKNTTNLSPDGTYYYIIKASCGGNTYTHKGFVQLIGEQ